MNGKLPPHDHEVEKTALGCILIDPNNSEEIMLHIKSPNVFYMEQNRVVYEAMVSLKTSFKPLDTITVSAELKKQGKLELAGGMLAVSTLMEVYRPHHWRFYVEYLNDLYVKRELINSAHRVLEAAYQEDSEVEELLAQVNKDLTAISDTSIRSNTQTSKELFKEQIKLNDILLSKKGALTGVPTGIKGLDIHTGGWQNSDLIILAARPGMGKTALATQHLVAPALLGMATAIFSLEMSNQKLYARIISQQTGVPLEKILRSGMNVHELQQVMAKGDLFCGLNIFFDDTGGLTLFELCNKARVLKRKHDIKLLIIDFLQLVVNKTKSGNREEEVGEVSRTLKALAKELNIPIIAIASLSRANEKRDSKKPIPSDLRGSGQIESDADAIIFVHRPEYYDADIMYPQGSARGVAEINIAKYRNGAVDNLFLRFLAEQVKFEDCNNNPWGSDVNF